MREEQLNLLLELLNEFSLLCESTLDCNHAEIVIGLVKEAVKQKERENILNDDAFALGILPDTFRFISQLNPISNETYTAEKNGKYYIVKWGAYGEDRYTEKELNDFIEKKDFIVVE